ncbi:cellulose biosynthesis protein BcsE [Burkholderia stagnalis]|uniref:Cellulose biosynthesis protein BcsE n=1 Tax=Burkholderia stagnalis TaxID=1503054 RepID=A0A6L3MKT8_9BURK|nr:cellulose biosynthesis protein BcsE [Burkholderia stagnalis]KAB0631469.1 cellulose biosynthesis protein BcsE [Burkholderia stagnalis]KVO36471.1 cellulose biosynthesis protein BcsE [Burkholderia stagnalis]KVO73942.1 cellulose biosynthesis protein BcsE [Burkholderia stagnalis]KVW65453.1 cellulose biosynthesis protein BcsE [Burkholderia stagnalis]KVW77705.1 cellulose biosynthesis protein BcsE [Burkholderia stagnalis]
MNTEFEATRPAFGAAGVFGRLRALLRMGPADGRVAALSRLAIDGLPDEWTQLEPGGLYAIYAAARTSASDALIWESARQARTRDVTVVLARDAANIAAQMGERGFAGGALAPGWPRNLNVLAMPPAGASDPAHADAARAEPGPFARLMGGFRAMQRFGFRARSLYFVEGAERWFSWHDPAALAEEGRAFADWCRMHRIAVVLLMDPEDGTEDAADPHTDDPPLVRDARRTRRSGFHSVCAGVSQLQRTHGELLWVVDFWRAGDTLAAGEVRPLRFAPSGRLSAIFDADTVVQPRQMKLASDEDRVVVSRAVVDGERFVPPHWEIVDDNAAVVAACAKAQAATAVLAFRTHAQLEALCAAVHTLRRQCGGALKIAIVERGEVLRHQFEMLVLSVGANSVVGRDLPFSRLQAAVHSLHGQLQARPVAADYRVALAAALGDTVLGYLPVGAFCLRIRAVLDRGAVLALPHTLVKMTLLPGVAHVDALRHCLPRRAGDVVTADAEHLYVFLFACEPADADEALKRIFDVPVETLSDRIVSLGNGSIAAELNKLKAENRRAPIADYSDLFAAVHPASGAQAETADAGAEAAHAAATPPQAGSQAEPQDIAPPPDAPAEAPAPAGPITAAARARGATRSAMPLRKPEAP